MPKKSKRVTLEELVKVYNEMRAKKRIAIAAKHDLQDIEVMFNHLTLRTSKEVLAQFVREGNIFNE